MSDLPANFDRLLSLADAVCAEDASADDLAKLDALLFSDEASRRSYLEYCQMHGALGLELRAQYAARNLFQRIDSDGDVADSARPTTIPLPRIATSASPILSDHSHGVFGYFFSGWPAAYLIATVIFGIGAIVGALTHVSHPTQLAKHPHTTAQQLPGFAQNANAVGRITGLVDCRWERKGLGIRDWGLDEGPRSKVQGSRFKVQGPRFKQLQSRNLEISKSPNPSLTTNHYPLTTHPKSLVCLGDQFILSSGLMEITYNTGAKVILQGPCTFEVDSADGGFLEIGKLTARVEQGTEYGVRSTEKVVRGEWPVASESLNPEIPKSPNPLLTTNHYPLFTIKTPTAVVTDLGTEFSVEVAEDHTTHVQVLEGSVNVAIGKTEGATTQKLLTAGNAISVTPQGNTFKSASFAPGDFIRSLPLQADSPCEKSYIAAVLADKPLGYWPLGEKQSRMNFRDRSGNDFHGGAMNKIGAEPSPLGADAYAITLDGESYIDIGRRDAFALANNFTVEAWVRIEEMKPWGCVISAADEGRSLGWGLRVIPPDAEDASDITITFVGWSVTEHDFKIPLTEVPADRWVHLAVVYDQNNTAHLYVNGQLRGSSVGHSPAKTGPVWVQIGCDIPGEHCWRGGLAHVAIYPRALDPQHIQNHYQQRNQNNAAADN